MAAAKEAIGRAEHVAVEMGTWSASPHPAAQVCRELLSGCDVFVALIGFRYGTPVLDDDSRSYTELEFDTATSLDIPRLVFVLDEDAERPLPLPPSALFDKTHGQRSVPPRGRIAINGAKSYPGGGKDDRPRKGSVVE